MTESHPVKTSTSILYAPTTGLAPNALFPFVTSPGNLLPLLRAFPPAPASQAQLAQALADLVHKSENNGPLLLQAGGCDDPLNQAADPLCQIISMALNFGPKDRKPFKTVLTLIKALVKRWTPRRHHFDVVYQRLSACAAAGESGPAEMAALKLLRALCVDSEEQPVQNYFFFSPFVSSLSLSAPESSHWEFSKGYTFVAWIKSEDMSAVERMQQGQPSALFRLKSSARGFECVIAGQRLLYRTSSGPGTVSRRESEVEDETKGIDLGVLPRDQWVCVAVSHSHNKTLSVAINAETKQFSAEYPKISDSSLGEFAVCSGFAGQLTSLVLYKVALSRDQLAEISAKLPYGVHDQQSYKSVLALPQQDVYLALSAISENKGTTYNLCGEKLTANLNGNAGVTHLLKAGTGANHIFSVQDVLPLLQSCCGKTSDTASGQRLLLKILKTLLTMVRHMSKYSAGTVRASQEYRLVADSLALWLPKFPHDVSTTEALGAIEEIAATNKETCDSIVRMLFDTRNYWTGTDLPVQSKYWEVLKANVVCFSGSECETVRSVISTMLAMVDRSTSAACCQSMEESLHKSHKNSLPGGHQSLNVRYIGAVRFLEALMPQLDSESKAKVVVSALVGAVTRPDVAHCTFEALISILDSLRVAGRETAKMVPAGVAQRVQEASTRFPAETQISCVKVLSKLVENSEEELFGRLCQAAGKTVSSSPAATNGREETRKISLHREEKAAPEGEIGDEEPDTSLLQEKVMSEEANINSTIKKIKQIKIDIQETNKAKTQREGRKFPVLSTDFDVGEEKPQAQVQQQQEPAHHTQEQHILSIEELVAQDPYKPPPAPKNEKMKAKRFFFGDPAEEEKTAPAEPEEPVPVPVLEKPKPKPQLFGKKFAPPALTSCENEGEEIALDPLPRNPRGFLGAKLPKGLAIDTEQINNEFDIGGEKGKKIVDEAEEEQKEEQEILELAEHCVLAMSRSSPTELVVSRYSSRPKGPLAVGLSVPITSTHKSTLMQAHKGPGLFPQSTKERKQFNFNLEGIDAIAATPIKEESLMTSKSSVAAHDNVELSPESDCVFAALFCYMLGKSMEPSTWKGNDLSMILLEFSEGVIVNPSATRMILKLARRCVGAGLTINPVLSALIKVCESSPQNRTAVSCDDATLRSVLKLEQELYVALHNDSNKAKNIVEFEQIIAFHASLVSYAVLDTKAMLTMERALVCWVARTTRGKELEGTEGKEVDPGIIADCFKYMWGKALTEVKQTVAQNEVASSPEYKLSTTFLAEITTLLLFQTSDNGNGITFSALGARSAPVVPFSDTELLKLLFDVLAPFFWRACELQDLLADVVSSSDLESYIATNKEELRRNHISPMAQENAGTLKVVAKVSGCVPCLALLLGLALKNAVGTSELEYWTQETELFAKYLLLLLEASRPTRLPSDAPLETNLLLLLGCLIQGCCEQTSPDEHRQLYSKTLAHVFRFLFSLIGGSESKSKLFYESQLGGKDGKCIVPTEEIRLMEGVSMAELMRVLTPEYGSLLEYNSRISEQLERLGKDFATLVQGDILAFCRGQVQAAVAEREKRNATDKAQEGTLDTVVKGWTEERTLADSEAKCKIALSELKREKKWQHVRSQVYGWQGAWRIQSEGEESRTIVPSSHHFSNGLRCLIKSTAMPENADSVSPEAVPQISVTAEEICKVLYRDTEERFKKKLPPPAAANLFYQFRQLEGWVMLHKPHGHSASLLFIGKEDGGQVRIERWRLDELKRLYRVQSDKLETVFYDGKTALLKFATGESRDLMAKKLVRLREKWCRWLKYDGTLDPIKSFQKSRATELWLSWQMPTLDYLLTLSRHCGRTFNDPERYPLLPYEPSILSESADQVISAEKMRGCECAILEKFTQYVVDPNKCPHCSIPIGGADVVPEVYSLPEILLACGTGEAGLCRKHRDEAGLPLPDDPYKYVAQLNEALEKNSVAPSSIVNNWIDRTFGVAIPEASSSGPHSNKPLFKTAHPAKSAEHLPSLWDPASQPKLVMLPGTESPSRITHIHRTGEGAMVVSIDGAIQCVRIAPGKDAPAVSLSAAMHYENNCSYSQWSRMDESTECQFPLVVLERHGKFQYVVQGGYLDGAIQLSPLAQPNKATVTLNYHASTVTCIAVDKEERVAITGTKNGDCMVFSICEDMFWKPRSTLLHHSSRVTSISVSNDMNLFLTSSADGTANLYSLSSRPELLRTFRPRGESQAIPLSQALLATSPIPCAVMYSREAGTVLVYSLNGELLAECEETAATVLGLTVVRDSCFCDYVVYWRDGVFVARRLPYLEERIIAECENVVAMSVEERQVVLATEDGKMAALFDDGAYGTVKSLPHN